jgi:WD40 repeat protein
MDRVVQLIPKTKEQFNLIAFSSDSNSLYYRKANALYYPCLAARQRGGRKMSALTSIFRPMAGAYSFCGARKTQQKTFYALPILTTAQTVVANNLWVAESSDVNQSRKLTLSSGGYDDLCWTHDKRILYVATESGDTGKRDIWIMAADGRDKQRLTIHAGNNRFPTMTPDGRFIIFNSNRNSRLELMRMASDGSNPQLLTSRRAEFPEITADGQWVVYMSLADGIRTIWKVPVAVGESVQLVAEDIFSFTISPDGTQLAYSFYDTEKQREVIAIKAIEGGSKVKELYGSPDFPLETLLQWTREGLTGLSNHSTEVIRIGLDGKPPAPLTNFKTGERIDSFAQSWDGKHMAFSRGLSTNEAILITNFQNR